LAPPENVTSTSKSTARSKTGSAQTDFTNSILAVHNGERAAVNASVPPLVWIDKIAADAKTWTDHLVITGVNVHCGVTPGCDTHEEVRTLHWVTGASNQNQTDQAQML
jgi:uncharacterized protein YkwD